MDFHAKRSLEDFWIYTVPARTRHGRRRRAQVGRFATLPRSFPDTHDSPQDDASELQDLPLSTTSPGQIVETSSTTLPSSPLSLSGSEGASEVAAAVEQVIGSIERSSDSPQWSEARSIEHLADPVSESENYDDESQKTAERRPSEGSPTNVISYRPSIMPGRPSASAFAPTTPQRSSSLRGVKLRKVATPSRLALPDCDMSGHASENTDNSVGGYLQRPDSTDKMMSALRRHASNNEAIDFHPSDVNWSSQASIDPRNRPRTTHSFEFGSSRKARLSDYEAFDFQLAEASSSSQAFGSRRNRHGISHTPEAESIRKAHLQSSQMVSWSSQASGNRGSRHSTSHSSEPESVRKRGFSYSDTCSFPTLNDNQQYLQVNSDGPTLASEAFVSLNNQQGLMNAFTADAASYYQGNSMDQPANYHLYSSFGAARRESLKPNQRAAQNFFIPDDLREELQRKSAETHQTINSRFVHYRRCV